VTNHSRGISVTFDLWGTLFVDQPELDDARNRLRYEGIFKVLADSGVRTTLADTERGYEQSASQFQAIWRQNKEIPTLEQVRMIVSGAGITELAMDSQLAMRLERAYVDPIFTSPPELDGDAAETLQKMKDQVRRLGLISNTGRSPGAALRELLRKYHVLRLFDSTIFSDEADTRKPDRLIFEKAAVALNSELSSMVHIGDDPEADAWGAKNAGMKAVLLDYPVPEGFRKRASSLLALSRSDRRIPDSDIRPDKKISSLREAVEFVSSLSLD
jgi:putative hydrolase of the HAD superfamily